jgi:DMSO/TMAO reductase YedYZ molybdopterin-dependent catalytic subunit
MEPTVDGTPDAADEVDRRRFLGGVFATSALITVFTVGQTVRPLAWLALLSPRRPDSGPQGFPVNATAADARVVDLARAPDYRLRVAGNVTQPLIFTLEELHALPQHAATLPIACVEGWSVSRHWTGVRVRDLLERAGAPRGADVRVESLQPEGSWRTSILHPAHARDRDTLLALLVEGEELALDHGYPLRLIAPNRPGVHQTKWVTGLVVL